MGELLLTRAGFTSYLGVSTQLKVRLGDEVVLKCSAGSSEEPTYYWSKDVRKPPFSSSVLIMPLEACHALSGSLPPLFDVTS